MTGPDAAGTRASVRTLDAAEAEARVGKLSAILVDAVAHGASVNLMAGLADDAARAFWRSQVPGVAGDERCFLAAEGLAAGDGGRLVGTVALTFAHQPDAPHRAETGRMLVLFSARRQGIGRRPLAAAEACVAHARWRSWSAAVTCDGLPLIEGRNGGVLAAARGVPGAAWTKLLSRRWQRQRPPHPGPLPEEEGKAAAS